MKLEAYPELDYILLSEEEIQAKVKELAFQISKDYEGRDLFIVGILKGAFMFLADFTRFLQIPVWIDFIVASSYQGAQSSGEVRILKDLETSIKGKHVLILEDIIDNGITLHAIFKTLSLREPATLKICTLLDKRDRRTSPIHPDYNGFIIPNHFVVGYGLDFKERYRNLPFVAVLKKEIYESEISKTF